MKPSSSRALGVAVVVALIIGAVLWLTSATNDDDAPPPLAPSSPASTVAHHEAPPPTRGRDEAEDDGTLTLAHARDSLDASVSATAADADADAGDALTKARVEHLLKENAAAAAKNVDAYCAATKDLVDEQDQRTHTRDAALFMAGKSDWEDDRIGSLHLAASITQRMANPPGAWRRMGPEVYVGLDFGWMKELLAFDHWSMVTAGPLRDLPARSFMEAPIPNFVTLQGWAKLRLLKGLHEGDLASASVEVRHLAELCGTTGSLVGDMIRVAIFGIERGFFEEHQLATPPALTQADATRLRSASFAAVDFLLPGVDPATREKALGCLPNRCTALVEAMGMTASLRPHLTDVDAHLAWLRARPQCDPALADLVARSPPAAGAPVLESVVATQLETHLKVLLEPATPRSP